MYTNTHISSQPIKISSFDYKIIRRIFSCTLIMKNQCFNENAFPMTLEEKL